MELKRADGGALHSVLAQPKRQALLAYLAVATPRGYHRRDTLVGLLWPDRDDESARAALSKAVHHLRQALGAETVVSRGHGDVGLDWHRIWCDAAGFEDALDRGALAEGMALYQGDLLPGFYIEDAPEFEQWLERERARLRGRATNAARELSEREESAGKLEAAIEWARRASSLDPLDETIVRRVMTLLDLSGDRADAARAYDELATRLSEELEVEPAPETTALMRAIRDRRVAMSDERGAMSDDRHRAVARPSPVADPSSLIAHRSSRLVSASIAALGILALATWAILGRDSAAPAAEAQPRVAVVPFAIDGASGGAESIGESMVTLVSDRLNHSGVLRAIDSRAVRSVGRAVSPESGLDTARALVARFHPAFVMLGRITRRDTQLVIDAALFDSVSRQPVARVSVSGSANDLATVASDLANELMEMRPTRRAPMWDRSPGVLTPSVPAMRAFLAGEKSYVDGHFADAAKSYKAAVDADTSFALAYLALSRAANWTGDYPLESFAIKHAYDHLDRLTTADQLLVKAWYAYGTSPREAERLSRLLVVNRPEMPDAWYVLAEARFHWGASFGWTRAEARDAYERAVLFLPAAGSLVHLARLAAADGNAARVDSLVGRALALGVDYPQSLELRGLRAYAMNDRAEMQRVNAAIAKLDDVAAYSVVTQLGAHTAEYAGSRTAADGLLGGARAAAWRVTGAVIASQLVMAHGRANEALRVLAGAGINASHAMEYRAALAVMPFRRLSPATLAALRDTLRNTPHQEIMNAMPENFGRDGMSPTRRDYLLAMFAIRLGDTVEARRLAADLEKRSDPKDRQNYEAGIVRLIRAELLRVSGKPAEALAALGDPRDSNVLPNSMDYPLAHERFLRGELARELRRWDDALRWYDTFPDPGAYDIAYLPAVHAAQGAVYEQLGNSGAARASYKRALALWSDADQEFAPAVALARQRLEMIR